MDNKSKILVLVLLCILILSVSATFYKTVVQEDFDVYEFDEESETLIPIK